VTDRNVETVATSFAAGTPVSPSADTALAERGGPAAELSEGTRIGRYTLLRRLGAGGMGVVYAARDGELARDIALKLLREDRGENLALQTRLTREAQAMARLAHANVVRVFDVGSHEGHVFLAMELIDGATLADWLVEKPRSWREVVDVYREAGRGLAEAHAAGIVHRDFKPGNVMIDRKRGVHVGDFGLARTAGAPLAEGSSGGDSSDDRLTHDGALVGTPRYMAPEQLACEDATAHSDQFAFAVSVFEGVAGVSPFRGATASAVLAEIRAGRIVAARMPGWLRRVLVRALAAEPAKRYPSMEAVLAALDGGRRRPARVAIGAGIIGLAAVSAAVAIAVGGHHEPPCAHAADRAMAAWTDAERARISDELPKLRPAFGRQTAQRSIARLDAYERTLAGQQVASCKATVGEAPAARIYDPQCLDDAVRALAKVTGALAGATPEVVDRTDDLLGQLPDCEHRAASAVRPPEPAQQPAVDALRDQLADADVVSARGDYAAALAKLTPLIARARTAGYPPLVAQVLARAGRLELQLHDGRGEPHLREAAQIAAGARDDRTAARAWTDLLAAAGNEPNKPERFDTALAAATTEVAHSGDPADRVQLDLVSGQADIQFGKFQDAEAACRRALAGLGDADTLATRPALHCIGDALQNRGDYTGGRTWYDRGLAIDRKILGDDHPQTAEDLQGLAELELRMGHFDDGLALADKALAVRERVFGADSDAVAKSQNTLANLLVDSGHPEDAMPHAQRALQIANKNHGPDSSFAASPLGTIGTILHDLHRKPEAEPYLAHAVANFERVGDQGNLGITLINQADNLIDEHKWDEALRASQHAITALEIGMGKDSQIVGFGLYDTARCLDATGKSAEAVPLLERAVKMVDPATSDPNTVAIFEYELARALWASGGDQRRSLALATDAHAKLVAIGDTAGTPAIRADVEAFLATHHAH
jgi:tetratricopeptide (TPR) repeat protein